MFDDKSLDDPPCVTIQHVEGVDKVIVANDNDLCDDESTNKISVWMLGTKCFR
jgi:hypothetical protein